MGERGPQKLLLSYWWHSGRSLERVEQEPELALHFKCIVQGRTSGGD